MKSERGREMERVSILKLAPRLLIECQRNVIIAESVSLNYYYLICMLVDVIP